VGGASATGVQTGIETGIETGALNLRWAERFIAAIVEAGVRDACVCAGSRSAPLALAIHRSSLRAHVPLDERAGAYFGLGLAKASRRPVALVCTSGTAAANFYPAVLEAFHARVPLVVLTADRPPELRDTGAAQTIDQIKLYGDRVRWFCEVGAPSPEPDLLGYVASLGRRAVASAWGAPAGPVHLNFAFREPLVPEPEALDAAAPAAPIPDRLSPIPFPASDAPDAPEGPPPTARAVQRVARMLRARRRGLILCGPDDAGPTFPDAVASLAAVTGYPILADPASGVRFGPHDRSRVLGAYDAFLRSPLLAANEIPEIVLQFGAALTSKAYHLYAARHREALHVAVDPAGAWRDPARRAREVIPADPALFARALADALARASEPLPGWGESFARAEAAARSALQRFDAAGAISEGRLLAELVEGVPDGTVLYVGNSMPIRDLDHFAPPSAKRIRVLANRGANGIDGVISSALGASAASAAPLLAVVGDLSFHHDLNGLSALREGRARATIVVVNNDGGGIFSFLPIARHEDAFERYFGTPHGLDFEAACALYGVPYARPATWEALRSGVASSLAAGRSDVIEVRTDRAENRSLHQAAWAEVVRAVEETR
jgi:2-succinyl-5-enolpyruvyl-6-hydroxy-3-cyclohexene-1-carboxylate synthase